MLVYNYGIDNKKTKLLLGGYFSSMKDQDAKERYMDKLHCIGGLDPYEMERKEWKDDVDLWPSITHVNLGYVPACHSKSIQWRRLVERQEVGVL